MKKIMMLVLMLPLAFLSARGADILWVKQTGVPILIDRKDNVLSFPEE